MFLDFYQLKKQPFGVTPDPNFLYLGASHREALASLSYGVKTGRGLMALIAPPGMGKTTLLFRLLEHLRGTARTAFLFQTQCDSDGLLRYLLTDLGINVTGLDFVAMHEQLNELLLKEARSGRRFVLVIDEAQNLSDAVLETARLLTDFETSREKLLQIVFAGQPQLAQKLNKPELAQLRQRIAILARLQPLCRSQVDEYIDHRLRAAGYAGGHLFSPPAVDKIAAQSNGTPRNINNLCFSALSLGYALRRAQIDVDIVEEVMSDLDLSGLTEQGYQPTTVPVTDVFPGMPARVPEATVNSCGAGFEPAEQARAGNKDPDPSVSLDELRATFLTADGMGILTLESLEHAEAEILVEVNDDPYDVALHADGLAWHFASINSEETVEDASDVQSSLAGASLALNSSLDRGGGESAAEASATMTKHGLVGMDAGSFLMVPHHLHRPVRTGRWSVFAFAFVLAVTAQPFGTEMHFALPGRRDSTAAVPSSETPDEVSQKSQATTPPLLSLQTTSTITVIVQPRDDLRRICLRYLGFYTDQLVSQINELNSGLTEGHSLAVGQRLMLPTSIGVADNASAIASVPKP